VRTSSPALSEEKFTREADAAGRLTLDDPAAETMTLGGTVRACVALLAILVIAGAFAWNAIEVDGTQVEVPIWYWICLVAGLVVAIVTVFKPRWAPFTGPVYAALEGMVVGGISKIFEVEFEGIVLQAVLLTLGVFVILLGLYASRLIKVTENFRMGVIAATGAIVLVYIVDLLLRAFGMEVPFIHDSGPIGIGISVVIVIIAALNLVLDFDFIENGVDARAPAYMNWYAAFGLLVTLVWLYLEILRLLAKTRR
jgi:uncharacterized YccA/Bax inhibitor family protein